MTCREREKDSQHQFAYLTREGDFGKGSNFMIGKVHPNREAVKIVLMELHAPIALLRR